MVKTVENLAKKKVTGGRRKVARTRRAYERDRYPTETVVGGEKTVVRCVRGGSIKVALMRTEYANVSDETGKVSRVKILAVVKNPADKDYERKGVLTKGALIKTELGVAKVTSRPGQDGVVNAVIVK